MEECLRLSGGRRRVNTCEGSNGEGNYTYISVDECLELHGGGRGSNIHAGNNEKEVNQTRNAIYKWTVERRLKRRMQKVTG